MDNISLLFDTDEKQYLKKKDSVKQDPTEDLFEILVHWIGETLYFNSYQDLFYWRREGKWALNLALDSESCWNSSANFKCLIGLNREIRAATRPLNNLTLESRWLIRLCRDAYNAYKSQLAG